MRIAERILWVIAAIAVVMKLLHIPLASTVFIISSSTLMILYLFLSWLILPTPTRKHQVIGISILAGIALTFLLEGILFKVQAWPMASFNLLVGLSLGSITLLLVWLLTRDRHDLKEYKRGILMRVVLLMTIGVLLYPVSARSMILFHHRGEAPAKLELYDRLYSIEDPDEREMLRQRIDSLEHEEMRTRR